MLSNTLPNTPQRRRRGRPDADRAYFLRHDCRNGFRPIGHVEVGAHVGAKPVPGVWMLLEVGSYLIQRRVHVIKRRTWKAWVASRAAGCLPSQDALCSWWTDQECRYHGEVLKEKSTVQWIEPIIFEGAAQ